VIADIIRVKAEQKDVVFICEKAPDLPRIVQIDEKRLRQVLLNLLGNAVKFTDQGQVRLDVQVLSTETDRSTVRFEVSDTGIGMSPDQFETIFKPFEQVGDAQRRQGGTGLGLAISQEFVRLMGSDIQVQSTPGRGSKFWFELSLPVIEDSVESSSARSEIAGYQGPRKKVGAFEFGMDSTDHRQHLAIRQSLAIERAAVFPCPVAADAHVKNRAHFGQRKCFALGSNPGVLHRTSFAKYAAAFLRNLPACLAILGL
jgi:hypothetical protein